jgi:hypothetical protein
MCCCVPFDGRGERAGGDRMKIKAPQDFWAGLMFIAFGLAFMIMALMFYQMGTAVRMGPAYFPAVLGGLTAVLGLLVLLGSLAVSGPKVPSFQFRPMFFVCAGCLAFAYLLKPTGVIVSIFLLVVVSALGGHEFKLKEVSILGAILAVFSVFVFVKGLTLPFPIWPAFMD